MEHTFFALLRPGRRGITRAASVGVALVLVLVGYGPAWAAEIVLTPGDRSAELTLPIPVSEAWVLTQGPHNAGGGASNPLSSIDLAGGSGHVVAAGDGYVEPVPATNCANPDPSGGLVVIDHGGGWHTSYYHLQDVQVYVGEFVRRGQWIGDIGMALPCGGHSGGPHVHFSVEYYTSGVFAFGAHMVDLRGLDIGGWTVTGVNFSGCLVNDTTGARVCAGQAGLVNAGVVG